MLPQLAQRPGNTFWVIPSEVTSAQQDVSRAFTPALPKSSATRETSSEKLAAHAAADAVEGAAEIDGYQTVSSSHVVGWCRNSVAVATLLPSETAEASLGRYAQQHRRAWAQLRKTLEAGRG